MSSIFQKVTNVKTIASDPSYQTTSNSWQYLSGSRILYKPDPLANFINYKFTFQFMYGSTDDEVIYVTMSSGSSLSQISSSPAEIENSGFTVGNLNSYSRRTVFYNHITPAWQGEKYIQTSFRHYGGTHDAELNIIDIWNDTDPVNIPVKNFLMVSSIL
tara:strand:- start:166 stop:642 length:477 start_codon:yes stop_codon:yes gene_type:complete